MPSKLAALLFAVTIGVGAFLLFLVQFILGKQILPWFGGVPAVWTTCMLFFQVLLLAGYGYAHLLGSRGPSRQRGVHLVALALSVGLLLARIAPWPSPITPSDGWKPGPGEEPIGAILVLLLFTVGLPYFVLATTGPLLQNWFARCFPGRSPYRLYALSNLGSLFGLLSYPFLLEPRMDLAAQGWLWFAGFLVFAIGCAGCAILVGRTAPVPIRAAEAVDREEPLDPEMPPTGRRRALWFGLAMTASVMLLAITSQISLEVAVIPFLWMLPLALYLLSFVLCFEYEGAYRRAVWIPILLVAAGGTTAVIYVGIGVPMLVQLGVYLATLFTVCMVCHGELVRHKPHPRYLTGFYLYVSAGGAAGGIFTGVLAPALFPDLWELPLALIAACAFALAVVRPQPASGDPVLDGILLRMRGQVSAPLRGACVVILAAVLGYHAHREFRDYFHVERGFFGVLRVDEAGGADKVRRRLKHGRIIHGVQFLDPTLSREPTSYYGPTSAVGLAIQHHPRRLAGQPLKLGVVGLGVGTLASYAEERDAVRFYEINPDVVALSSGPAPVFTYLRDCRGTVDISLGDARVNLEREPVQGFQVLALDAFSSDSIPAHLLTLEAGRVYLRHLAEDGILAVHISNRYLDLEPVVRGLAAALGLVIIRIDSEEANEKVSRSTWMLLTRDAATLAAPAIKDAAAEPPEEDRSLLWTDTYSNLLEVFKG
jgi:hypothetical protein